MASISSPFCLSNKKKKVECTSLNDCSTHLTGSVMTSHLIICSSMRSRLQFHRFYCCSCCYQKYLLVNNCSRFDFCTHGTYPTFVAVNLFGLSINAVPVKRTFTFRTLSICLIAATFPAKWIMIDLNDSNINLHSTSSKQIISFVGNIEC